MNVWVPCALILAAFLLGSIPFGVLVTRKKGVNLMKIGSGNIGATNVLRTCGKSSALVTLLGDSLKGTGAVLLSKSVSGDEFTVGLAGIAAVMGHMHSPFLSFKGGKGVATGFGVLLPFSPVLGLITIITWLLTALLTRYSSLAAVSAYALLPVIAVLLEVSRVIMYCTFIIAFLIIFKHRDNMKRLLNRTEKRIGDRKD